MWRLLKLWRDNGANKGAGSQNDVKMKGTNVTNDESVIHHGKAHDVYFKFDVWLRL
jgi:hypothetical protein